MDIKEKLRQLDSLQLRREIALNPPQEATIEPPDIASALKGQIVSNQYGSFLLAEKSYPDDYHHGEIRLSALLEESTEHLSIIGKNKDFEQLEVDKILFIDTETTGLSGGAGTCAFLIGIGFFDDKEFRVRQYFMSDFHEEAALLHELNQLSSRFQCLVSYNGKSFDLPLILSRYIFQSQKTLFHEIRHFDLLHTIRRLWKHKLMDCSLSNAEQSLARVQRTHEDIPGFLIPLTYFEYLRSRDPFPIKPVFYHNEIDILSMAALLVKALRMIQDPMRECETAMEIIALGRLYEACERLQDSNDLYLRYLENSNNKEVWGTLLRKTAMNYKKLQKWSLAEEYWRKSMESERFHPLPYIELAKYYEHKKRKFSQALELVDKALNELNILLELRYNTEWIEQRENLLHRKKRLQMKLNKS